MQATADGILDAAVLSRYEMAVRPEPLRWKDWIEGQKRKNKEIDELKLELRSLRQDYSSEV